MKYLFAITMLALGLLIGSAQSVDAGHDKPCTPVPTKTATHIPTRTPTSVSREKCAAFTGQGPCVFHPPSGPYGR